MRIDRERVTFSRLIDAHPLLHLLLLLLRLALLAHMLEVCQSLRLFLDLLIHCFINRTMVEGILRADLPTHLLPQS